LIDGKGKEEFWALEGKKTLVDDFMEIYRALSAAFSSLRFPVAEM
jgi:hypothetical protein